MIPVQIGIIFLQKKLVEKGYKVNVVTANVDYKKAAKRFKGKFYFRKKIDGIDVTYVQFLPTSEAVS